MDGDTVREMHGKQFTLIQRTREDPDFYCLMGRFFGSRVIATALGMPMYDDEHRQWWLILNEQRYPVACASLEHKPGSKIAALKSAWVEPDARGHGLYEWLLSTRLEYAAQLHLGKVTSTVTEMSKSTHERHGFRCVGRRGKYYIYWKEIGNV